MQGKNEVNAKMPAKPRTYAETLSDDLQNCIGRISVATSQLSQFTDKLIGLNPESPDECYDKPSPTTLFEITREGISNLELAIRYYERELSRLMEAKIV